MKIPKSMFAVLLLLVCSSCRPGIQDSSDLSANHINYIKSLGLLTADEHIILFDAQYRIRISGNFFTNQRIASYFINTGDPKKSIINSAFYHDIDSINLVKLTDLSYLNVYKTGGQSFKVVVKADSIETKYFFDTAIAEWKKHRPTSAETKNQ